MTTRFNLLLVIAGLTVLSCRVDAEVMDKMPGPSEIWLYAMIYSALGFLLCRAHPLFGIVTFGLGTMQPFGVLIDDANTKESILAEAGPAYFTHAKVALWTVVLSHSAGVGIWMAKQKHRKREIAELEILETTVPVPEPRPESLP